MPKYLDLHPTDPNVPSEVIQGIKEQLEAGKPDEFGVTGLNMFVTEDLTYCYTEASDASAIHKSHEKKGLTLGPADVKEVQSLL